MKNPSLISSRQYTAFAAVKSSKERLNLNRFYKTPAYDAESLKTPADITAGTRNRSTPLSSAKCGIPTRFVCCKCGVQKLPSSNFTTVRQKRGGWPLVAVSLPSGSHAHGHVGMHLCSEPVSPVKVTSCVAQAVGDSGVTSTGSLRPRPLQNTFISHFVSALIEITCITVYLDKYTSKYDYFINGSPSFFQWRNSP
jgi:hypothetical protein